MLLVQYTAVIGISTPQDEFNFYSKMFNIKGDSDETLFYTIRIGQSCQDCLNKRIKCIHKIMRIPDWQPSQNREKVAKIMASDPELHAREAGGDIVGTVQYVFEHHWLNSFYNRPLYTFQHHVQVLHIGIDPSGGGRSSEFVILSMAFENGQYIVCGIDRSDSYEYNEIKAMIEMHLKSIRSNTMLCNAYIYIYFEANLSSIMADEFAHFFRNSNYGPLEVVTHTVQKNIERFGTLTTNESKEQMVKDMRQLLSDGNIVFADKLIGLNIENSKTQLLEQLKVFRKEKKNINNLYEEDKYIYTGKSSGQPDDLAFDLCNTVSLMMAKRKCPEYLKTAQLRHWARF